MPFINIRVLEGTLSDEQKSEMIKKVSETVAEIEARPNPKENLIPHTWCVIEEVNYGAWGIGGNAITPDILQQILKG
jgi:4-oxalocrotonate tautomerase